MKTDLPPPPIDLVKRCAKAYTADLFTEVFSFDLFAYRIGACRDELKQHFGDAFNFQLQMLNYVHGICFDEIFIPALTCSCRGRKLILQFLKYVDACFNEHPECFHWLKAYYSIDIILSEQYENVLCFHRRWESVVVKILKDTFPDEEAETVGATYMDILRACSINQNEKCPLKRLTPARFFFFHTLRRIELQGLGKIKGRL